MNACVVMDRLAFDFEATFAKGITSKRARVEAALIEAEATLGGRHWIIGSMLKSLTDVTSLSSLSISTFPCIFLVTGRCISLLHMPRRRNP